MTDRTERRPLFVRTTYGIIEGYGNADGSFIVAETGDTVTVFCAWFGRCTNVATVGVAHPILGTVPACARCADLAK